MIAKVCKLGARRGAVTMVVVKLGTAFRDVRHGRVRSREIRLRWIRGRWQG